MLLLINGKTFPGNPGCAWLPDWLARGKTPGVQTLPPGLRITAAARTVEIWLANKGLVLPRYQSSHKAASVRFLTFSFDRIELT